jgi:lipopolysaccharide transport system ATP-binding protein
MRDLTGRENAMLAGVVAGLLADEMAERLPEVVQFAELVEHIDAPLRTYSSGMQMRLAFAVAVHTDPGVLLVDEVLAVGDLAFQAKCHDRINALRSQGCAILMVSHGMADVKALCDRVLWLRQGEVAALGRPHEVADRYEAEMDLETLRRSMGASGANGGSEVPPAARDRSLEPKISRVTVRPSGVLSSGDPLEVDFDLDARSSVESPILVMSITSEDGTKCIDTNTASAGIEVPDLAGPARAHFSINRLELGAGRYFVNVGIFDATGSHAYDFHWHAHALVVEGSPAHGGVLAPPCRWRVEAPL